MTAKKSKLSSNPSNHRGQTIIGKPENNIILYQDENGVTKVNVRFSDEDLWLTQLHFHSINL